MVELYLRRVTLHDIEVIGILGIDKDPNPAKDQIIQAQHAKE